MLRRFFVFLRHTIFITSPLSLPSLTFTSPPSPFLFSSLLFSSSSLLPVVFRCLCCVSSHLCATFASGRGVDWAVQDVAQLRQWLDEGRKPRERRKADLDPDVFIIVIIIIIKVS